MRVFLKIAVNPRPAGRNCGNAHPDGRVSRTFVIGNTFSKIMKAIQVKTFGLSLVGILAAGGFIGRPTAAAAQSGPIASWHADGSTEDSSGNNNQGTNIGAARYAQGLSGQAFEFNGRDEAIKTAVDTHPDNQPAMTWSAWILPRKLGGKRQVLSSDNGGYKRSLLIQDGRLAIFTGGCFWETAESADAGTWQHVAVVFEPGEVRFYKNGVESFHRPLVVTSAPVAPLCIGCNPAFGEHFGGLIDEIEVFDRALTGEEIATIYEKLRAAAEAAPRENNVDTSDAEAGNVASQTTDIVSKIPERPSPSTTDPAAVPRSTPEATPPRVEIVPPQNVPAEPGRDASIPRPTATLAFAENAGTQSGHNLEWPQWRGPERNGAAYFSPTLANAWPPVGPKKVWSSKPVSITPGPYAGGHSSPVIAGGKVYQYVADREGKQDIVLCLDAAHGTAKWTRRFPSPYRLMHGASGTPCIADDRVYVMGGRNAYCLDANTGTTVWMRAPLMTRKPNFPGDYLQEESSSFVVGERVAAVVVDQFAGLDLATGKTLWTTPSPGGYALAMASAVFWSHEGKKYLIYSGFSRICCVDPSGGKVIWEVTGNSQGHDHVHTPVVVDDYLICFWQGKLGFYHMSLDGPKCFYEALMADKHSSPVVFKNRVYFVGCPDRMSSTVVECHNLETGETIWRHPVKNPEYSSPILADNKIFLLTDQGKKLTMLDALNGDLLGECPIDAKPWTSPAFAMGYLFVRKVDDGISCYDLKDVNNVSTRKKSAFFIKASASNVFQGMEEYSAEKAFDGNAGTRWAVDGSTHEAWIAAEFSKDVTVVGLKVNEAPASRVQKFKLEYKDGGVWKTALSGTTIGEKYEKSFLRASSREWRLNILEATEGPTINEIEFIYSN